MQLVVRTWNVFHGNADPPRQAGYLRRMIELVTGDGPDVVCLQEVPVWALPRIDDWSGMRRFDAVTRPPLWPGPVSKWVTRAHQGFFRSGLAGQANAILVAPRHAATDLGHERISEHGRERRLVHAVRIAGSSGVTVANLHASNDHATPRRAARGGDARRGLRGGRRDPRRRHRARGRLQRPRSRARGVRGDTGRDRSGPGPWRARRVRCRVAPRAARAEMASCSPTTPSSRLASRRRSS